jgi:hypothetical protein
MKLVVRFEVLKTKITKKSTNQNNTESFEVRAEKKHSYWHSE